MLLRSVLRSAAASKLPFQPATLVFRNITFEVDVKVPGSKALVPRVLLQGVNGYARPGQLTALMVPSPLTVL